MSKDIDLALRRAITESGLSNYRLAKDSGVAAHTIGRFLANTQTIRFDAAAKLAMRLGLELTPSKGK